MEKSLTSKLKELTTHTLIYGLGSISQVVLGFVLIPLYTRYYTTEMYGVLSLVTLCGVFSGSIFYLGASSALSRSYYDHETDYERKKTASTALFLTMCGAALQILFGFFFKDFLSQALFHDTRYAFCFWMISISTAFTFVNGLFTILLRFGRKSMQVVVTNLITLVLTTALILYFLTYAHLGVLAPILGTLFAQVVLFLILFTLVRKSFVFDISILELKLQLRFGMPMALAGFLYYSLDWIDRLFVNKYCTLSDVGIYSLGYKLGMFIHSIFIVPFGLIWTTMRMEYRKDSNAGDLYKLVLSYYFIIGLFVTVVISLYAKEILTLISGNPDYVVAYKVVPYIMVAHLFYGVISIVDNGIYFERKASYYAYVMFFGVLINAILNFLFVPRYGYMASAYATLVSYLFTSAAIFYVSNRLHPLDFESRRLVKIFTCGFAALVVGCGPAVLDERYSMPVKVLIVTTLSIVWYRIILNEKERIRIYGLIRKVLHMKSEGVGLRYDEKI